MEFTYEDFKSLIRQAILTHRSAFKLDVQDCTKQEIAQIIVWCERDGYCYDYDENAKMINIEFLKGFGR